MPAIWIVWSAIAAASLLPQETKDTEKKSKPVYSTDGLPESIKKAVEHKARGRLDLARDAARKPGHVLQFFGIKPGMKVGDLMAGDGYYTVLVRVQPVR